MHRRDDGVLGGEGAEFVGGLPGEFGEVGVLGLVESAVAAGEQQECGDEVFGLAVGDEQVLADRDQMGGQRVGEADFDAGALGGQGVRSSWEALATNRRWLVKDLSRRSSIVS